MDTPATDPRIEMIVQFVSECADGASLSEIEEAITPKPQHRTLQFWVSGLCDAGRLKSRGAGRATRYVVPKKRAGETQPTAGMPPATNTGLPQVGQSNVTGSSRPQFQPVPVAAVTTNTGRMPLPSRPSAVTTQAQAWAQPATLRAPGATTPAISEPAAAPEPVQQSRVDPAIAAQIRRVVPMLMRKLLDRATAEENLALEGVRAFHDDTATIRIFMAEAMAEMESLTKGDRYLQYGIKPNEWEMWRKWWR